MTEETGSGGNWSRVADIFARVANEKDPLSANGRGNQEIFNVVDATLPLTQASFILDVGAGPGQVLGGLLSSPAHTAQIPSSCRIVATDLSQAFVKMLQDRRQENIDSGNDIWNRVEVTQWDARDFSELKDGQVSHLLAGHCYVAMKDEERGLREALRVLAPGGIFVETSLGDTEWARLPDFVTQVRPDKRAHTTGAAARSWWTAESVKKKLTAAEFRNVQAREYPVTLAIESYEEVLVFIFEGFPFMKGFVEDMSSEEVERVRELMMGYLKEKHPQVPLRLKGTGVVGWGTK